jgi:arylsulfatase A-like enzyme
MGKINELGVAGHTYLIYMSDNGGGGGNPARPGKKERRRPLTAGKGGLWEGGIRVPLIIRGPGVKSGVFCHTRVVGYDLFPTFCKLAGVEGPLPDGVEGGDLTPLFAAGTGTVARPREALVFHFPHYQGDTPHSAILLGDYKLIKWYEHDSVKLFNLAGDISESKDLSQEMPEKTLELKTMLENYLEDVHARLPRPNPHYDPAKPSVEKRGQRGDPKTGGGRVRGATTFSL